MSSENIQEKSGSIADFDDADNLIGKNLGVFKIVRELGRGGMGRVYLATRADGEFRQTVAIKLIKRGMDTDFILKRFRNERQILATLDHPYTARLLDGGTTTDGSPYFVMEYVEGKPLYAFCDEEKLSINARLKLFRRICEAVEYAHRRKIIHRDIKPGNILVNEDEIPKLLDFGIAKLLDSEQIHESINPTTGFMKLLTVEYASPEQICGGEITPASDIYSLGVLLYELLTGHRVYDLGENRSVYQISQAVCEEQPDLPSVAIEKEENFAGKPSSPESIARSRGTNLKSLKNELSGNLDRIILKALAKSPGERFQSVAEFSEIIEAHLNGSTVNIKPAVAAKNIVYRTSDPATGGNKAIAVLPLKFLNPGTDEDTGDRFLGLGLADSLITRLSGVKRFIVRPTSSILQYGEGFYDPFEAGEKLGVEYILDGNIYKSGTRIRVSLQFFNVADKSTIWAEKFDEKSFDVLQLEDVISNRVAESLIPRLTSEEREHLAKRGTDNPQAFEMYLRGRAFWNKFTPENLVRAFESYEKAVALDPGYAQAFAGLADYYTWLGIYGVVPPGEALPKAIEAGEKAVALDDELAEAHATLGFAIHAGNYDVEKGEYHLTRALELNQNYASAFSWLAIVRFTQGRFDEGLKLSDRAAEFDPLAPYNKYNYAWGLYYARRFDESIERAEKLTREFPAYGLNYYVLSKTLRFIGRVDEAFTEMEKAKEIFGKSAFITFSEAECFAAAGKILEAKEELRRLDEMSASGQYVSPYQTALVYCYLKDKENALENLEKAFELKEPWLNWINVEPVFDFVREEARFRKIVAQVDPTGGKKSSPDTSENNPKSPTEDFLEAETAAYSLSEKRKIFPSVFRYAAAAILILVAGFALYKFAPRTNSFRNPFNDRTIANWKDNFLATTNLRRLTTGGREVSAGISPDGKLVAYVSREDENYGLWLRSIDSDDARQIVSPAAVFYSGVVFSPDGKYIYYSIYSRNYAERTLFRINISAENPAPEKILDDVNAAIGFSPDGKLFAYYSFNRQTRVASLLIAEMNEPNGAITATRTLASASQPNVFVGNPSFSPDGKKIFYPLAMTVEKKQFVNLFVYDLDSNAEEKFSNQSFGDVSATAWRKNGDDIIISANDKDNAPFQLWLLSFPSGEATRLTDASTNYFGLSLAQNADVLISAKRERTSSLWSIDFDGSGNARQLTAGAEHQDGFYGITSSGDKLIFVSGTGTETAIQMIDAGGKNAKTLPIEVSRPNNPLATKDGRFLLFADSKGQESVIWRYEFSSGELKQATPGYSLTPTLTPDEKTIVYAANNDQRRLSLFKIPISGGEQVQINQDLAVAPAISPDGKLIACYLSGKQTNGEWKLAVLSLENGASVRIFDLPETVNLQIPPERPLAWSPDNRFIYYVNDKNGVSNIFKISLDETAAPEKVTNFSTGRIFDFTLFGDGRRIAYSQGAVTSEIVMFSNQNSKR